MAAARVISSRSKCGQLIAKAIRNKSLHRYLTISPESNRDHDAEKPQYFQINCGCGFGCYDSDFRSAAKRVGDILSTFLNSPGS